MFIVKCYLSFIYIVCSYHPNSNGRHGNLLFPEKFCEVLENFFSHKNRVRPRVVNSSTFYSGPYPEP